MLARLLHVRSAPLTVSSISSSITSGGSQRDALAGVCRPRSAGNRDHVPSAPSVLPSAAAHPGRETAAEDEHSQQANSEHPDKGALVIAGLGGKRMSVRWATVLPVCGLMCGPALIQQTLLKESGGSSVLIKGNHVRYLWPGS